MKKSKIDSNFCLLERFIKSSHVVSQLIEKNGVTCSPFHNSDLPHFSLLDLNEQKKALHSIELYERTLVKSEERCGNLKNNSESLWQAILEFGYRQPADFFSLLEEDDVIEIYNSQGLQVWRNINFMKICSYTLEEMLCVPWYERYDRRTEDTDKIMKSVEKVLNSYKPIYFHEQIDDHQFEEKFSERRFTLQARHDYFCPLFGHTKQAEAFIVTSKVEILRENRKRKPRPRPPLIKPVETIQL